MTIKKFIEKWNVGYEDFEQKQEFAREMKADLKQLIEQAISKLNKPKK
jgi:hypothetical protein